MTAIALVQGASRGLGLAMVKSLAARPGTKVVATCRRPQLVTELHGLDNVTLIQCDVTNEGDVKATAAEVARLHGKLDLAVNVSGILHPSGKGETRVQDVDFPGLQETFAVNTFGPLIMAKHLAPLLQKGSGLFGCQKENSRHTGVLAHVSARVGSISDNKLGGWYSYRMSKAALNMANKNLAIELGRGKRKVVCLVLHPGTVDTDLSRPYHRNVPSNQLFTAQYSVDRMLGLVEAASMEDTGNYMSWDGQTITF